MALTERYRPLRITDFAGLDKPKRICSRIAQNPQRGAYLFVGPSGTGKSSMARALAREINAEIQFIPSQECNLPRIQQVVSACYYAPMFTDADKERETVRQLQEAQDAFRDADSRRAQREVCSVCGSEEHPELAHAEWDGQDQG